MPDNDDTPAGSAPPDPDAVERLVAELRTRGFTDAQLETLLGAVGVDAVVSPEGVVQRRMSDEERAQDLARAAWALAGDHERRAAAMSALAHTLHPPLTPLLSASRTPPPHRLAGDLAPATVATLLTAPRASRRSDPDAAVLALPRRVVLPREELAHLTDRVIAARDSDQTVASLSRLAAIDNHARVAALASGRGRAWRTARDEGIAAGDELAHRLQRRRVAAVYEASHGYEMEAVLACEPLHFFAREERLPFAQVAAMLASITVAADVIPPDELWQCWSGIETFLGIPYDGVAQVQARAGEPGGGARPVAADARAAAAGDRIAMLAADLTIDELHRIGASVDEAMDPATRAETLRGAAEACGSGTQRALKYVANAARGGHLPRDLRERSPWAIHDRRAESSLLRRVAASSALPALRAEVYLAILGTGAGDTAGDRLHRLAAPVGDALQLRGSNPSLG